MHVNAWPQLEGGSSVLLTLSADFTFDRAAKLERVGSSPGRRSLEECIDKTQRQPNWERDAKTDRGTKSPQGCQVENCLHELFAYTKRAI